MAKSFDDEFSNLGDLTALEDHLSLTFVLLRSALWLH